MFKKAAAFIVCALTVMSMSACAGPDAKKQDNGKIKVSVTFNAMKEFAKAVGKDKIDVSTIIPDGTEPHDFELKAKDMIALSNADVFIYNGMGMETWVDNAIKSAGNQKLIAVEASKGVTPIKNTDSGEVKEHGQYDPHVWLSIKCAQTQVKNIADAFSKADPANRDYYSTNSKDYTSQLEKLYQDYDAKFKSAARKNFVTGHAAFAYLCRDFGLKQNSVEDVFAEGEPSAQNLKELIDYCKNDQVKTVFVEEMVSPAVSKTLADSVGANVETIYTMESSEENKTYVQRMQKNLDEIYKSLS